MITDRKDRTFLGKVVFGNIVSDKGTGTSKVLLDSQGNLTAQSEISQVLTDAATVVFDYSLGTIAKVTLAGNRTLSITNVNAGDSGKLIVKQDATGSRTLALPSGSLKAGGSLTLTTTANAVDVLSFFYDGTNYYWSISAAYA